jgi:peptide/nickel transport system substrate-binding protein
VLLSTASASTNSTPIPSLRVGISGNSIPTLDLARYANAAPVSALGMETLLRIDPTSGQLRPWLAASWRQRGPVTYVYSLRKGVRFWNGKELTAADVAHSWNYWRYPGARFAATFASVRSVTSAGKYTVVVTLKRRDATWATVPAHFATQVFEKEFQEAHKTTFGQPGTLVMGTGPWKFDSLDPTRGVELSANPRWWGGKVNIPRVSFKFFADEQSEALAWRAGELDLVPVVGDPRSFAATAGTRVIPARGSTGLVAFSMNTQRTPWKDVHVRRAVAYAIGRQDLITAAGGYATPLHTLIPTKHLLTLGSRQAVNSLLKSLPAYPFNLARARQELAKSAYPNGFSTDLEIPSLTTFPTAMQALAGQLAKIGIRAQVKTVPIGAWIADIADPAKRPATLMINASLSPDPGYHPSIVLGSKNAQSGRYNAANYAPPEVDRLLSASVATTDPTKRLAIYGRLLKRLATDVPYIPLYSGGNGLAISSKLTWSSIDDFWANRPWALEIKSS